MNDSQPVMFQKIESIVIALFALFIYAKLGFVWYYIPLLFIAFDLSALGYLFSPKIGAFCYNAVHNYAIPVGALLVGYALGNTPDWVMFTSLIWIFHIAADRLMGYGLKHPDAFTHTHLGVIGKSSK